MRHWLLFLVGNNKKNGAKNGLKSQSNRETKKETKSQIQRDNQLTWGSKTIQLTQYKNQSSSAVLD